MYNYAWTIPPLASKLSLILNLMKIEVVIHSIKESAGSTIEGSIFECRFHELVGDVEQNRLLGGMFFLGLAFAEGIVVVAVAVYVVRVDFIKVLLQSDGEIAASC